MPAYFRRNGAHSFLPSSAVQGAWNTEEQHIAPVLGIIAQEIEADHRRRHAVPLQLARVAYDILGTVDLSEVHVDVRLVRAGRTIELVEGTLTRAGRVIVVARAWFLTASDTTGSAGSDVPPMPHRDDVDIWQPASLWPGEYVTTVDVRRRQLGQGRAQLWIRPRLTLIDDEPVSPTVAALGLVDIANGMTPRVPPDRVAFPNVDLTVHLHTAPRGEWLGFDTTVSFGATGVGITHSVLHDEFGSIGTAAQSLTLRPR